MTEIFSGMERWEVAPGRHRSELLDRPMQKDEETGKTRVTARRSNRTEDRQVSTVIVQNATVEDRTATHTVRNATGDPRNVTVAR
jgi:hypothetical protein